MFDRRVLLLSGLGFLYLWLDDVAGFWLSLLLGWLSGVVIAIALTLFFYALELVWRLAVLAFVLMVFAAGKVWRRLRGEPSPKEREERMWAERNALFQKNTEGYTPEERQWVDQRRRELYCAGERARIRAIIVEAAMSLSGGRRKKG